MNPREEAAWELHRFFRELGLSYAIIGGAAVQFRVCSAEDLIIHKAIAGRPQDVRDVEGIVYRQRDGLDVALIRRWLQAFAELLDNPEIVERFERPWRRIHASDQRR